MPKALIVVTNVGKFEKEDKATGLWLAEAVHFYEKLIKAGWTVDFVSPKGGFVPIDPASLQKENMTPSDWKHYTCPDFQKKLQSSLKPSDVKADDYQCIYYSGGHGVVFDFPDNKELQQIAQDIYKKGGVVSSVCHGAVGLLHIKDQKGEHLIKGKNVTGFSNEEEKIVGAEKIVPFSTEDELTKQGGNYVKGGKPWGECVVEDNRVVTGQNPGSAGACADHVLKLIK